ncbi:hypothetical protein [Kitasatospora indigofera]|nr:hypothetical protein [Kitasatospora indigofera]
MYSTGWLNPQARLMYCSVEWGLITVSAVPCMTSTGATVLT